MLNAKDCAARGERRASQAGGAVALVDGRRRHLVEDAEAAERTEVEEALASEACFAIMVIYAGCCPGSVRMTGGGIAMEPVQGSRCGGGQRWIRNGGHAHTRRGRSRRLEGVSLMTLGGR